MARLAPKILREQTIARSRLFHIQTLDLQFSNGVEVQFERLCSNSKGAVLVVPMLDDNTVLLIREYAAGVQRYELALPKGRLEQGESILEAANREIMEEVGYGARQLLHIKSFSIAPSYLNHETHIVLATDLFPQRMDGDEPEDIDVVPWSLENLHELLQHPECTEARSIAALFMARDLMRPRP
ncbi:MAG: ADP compounds hydrolase NudE [Gammaproteobacteria bacterium]|nr:ADP compounds hydrolase NudE [Gammaproteobacteria bacterium]